MTTTKQTEIASPIAALPQLGTSVWLDSLSRAMIESGELERLVAELGVVGVTATPAIFEKAFSGGSEYDKPLESWRGAASTSTSRYEALAVEDVRAAADVLRQVAASRTTGSTSTPGLPIRACTRFIAGPRAPISSRCGERLRACVCATRRPSALIGAEALRAAARRAEMGERQRRGRG